MKELKPLLVTCVFLFALALTGSIFLPTRFTSLATLALALFAYLIVPGYTLLLHLNLKTHERIILGSAASTALLPLIYYTLDIIGVPLSRTTVLLVIILVSGLSYGVYIKNNS